MEPGRGSSSPPLSSALGALSRASAQGRLEGNALKLGLLTTDCSLDATPPRGPRIRPGGRENLERGRLGVGDVLLQLQGISLRPGVSPKSKSPQKEIQSEAAVPSLLPAQALAHP